MAEKAKLSRQTIRRYETGDVARQDSLVEIAGALGVRVYDLMISDDEQGFTVEDSAAVELEIDGLVQVLKGLPARERRDAITHIRGFIAGMRTKA